MLTPYDKRERGQAIVLLVLAMVALIAFAAIALDGGQIFSEQRRAQAAADNAVMAAAFAAMKGQTATGVLSATALANAAINDYDNDGVDNRVRFFRPPVSGPYAGNRRYFQVTISRTVPTVLAHFVYRGPWQVTVSAVAHGDTAEPLMNGYAIATLRPNCSGESMISMQGRGGGSTGGTIIRNGGAFVNASCEDAIEMSGSNETFIIEDAAFPIDVVGGADPDECPSPNFDPCPTTGRQPVTQDPIQGTTADDPPPCGPARDWSSEVAYTADGVGTIRPGTYEGINLGQNDPTVTMLPGIYCINGTNANTAKVSSGANGLYGSGVLLYLATLESNIDISGQGVLDISSASLYDTNCTTSPLPDICNYLGIIIYKTLGRNSCSQNDVEIKFSGQGEMYVRGLIYAPLSLAQYGGSGSLTMTGQSLVGCVKFNGNGLIDITYDPDSSYTPPPDVALDK